MSPFAHRAFGSLRPQLFLVRTGRPHLYWPWWAFGLVASLACLAWGSARLITSRHLVLQMAVGSIAGILGSLWWWSSWEASSYSLLHGTIWGCLVGLGVWQAGRRAPAAP